MYDLRVPTSAVEVRRLPSFTLATALVLLGHDCPGRCPQLVCEWRAAVWFVRLPAVSGPTWTRTLIDVAFLDAPWTLVEQRRTIGRINDCVRPDHLRVRARTAAQRATFSEALAGRRALSRPEDIGSHG